MPKVQLSPVITVRSFLSLTLLLWAGSLAFASESPRLSKRVARSQERTVEWCGTSLANNAETERLARWVEAKANADRGRGRIQAQAAGEVRYERGVFLMERDNRTAPFDAPFDLENSSLLFTRTLPAAFTVQKTPLAYDTSLGTLRRSFDSSGGHEAYHLNSFVFPFYSMNVSDIYISATKGIFLSPPPQTNFHQYSALEAVTQRIPLISPLLQTTDGYGTAGRYDLYLRETATSLTLTWKTRSPFEYEEDIQVTLFSSGNIQFSYRKAQNVFWGTVIVTSGQETWYTVLTPLLVSSDPIGDVTNASIPTAYRGMLDVERVDVRRISNSNLVEFEITVQTPIHPASLPAGASLDFYLDAGGTSAERDANSIYVWIWADGVDYGTPAWPSSSDSPAVSVSGRTIKARVTDDLLAIAATPTTLNVDVYYYPGNGTYPRADFASTVLPLGAPIDNVTTDLSSLTSATVIAGKPVLQAFTLPMLNVHEVWSKLKTTFGMTDAEIDQVAIYQTFYTDLIFYAGGYSTGGNPAANGIAPPGFGISFAAPKEPALMHLDKLGRGWNGTPDGRLLIQTHEFGHRWLYYLQIRENGISTNNLNPDRVHPKQGAHMPAAFSVITAADASAMGGGLFNQTGTNTYRTVPLTRNYGYTWHELYLMGLAFPAEVTPWYYLNGSGLQAPYYPQGDFEYVVTSRNDVVVQQVIDALGPRHLPYGTSAMSFKEIFVVLQRPGETLTNAEVEQFSTNYRAAFKRHFGLVTGGRGSVVTTPDFVVPTADFTFAPALPAIHTPITFTDRSEGEPVSWSWNFGDQTALSTEQNPTHSYTTAGSKTVTLAVTRPSGSHSVSKTFTVSATPIVLRGDANGDGTRAGTDVIYLLGLLFAAGPPAPSLLAGDANSDGVISIADVFFLINFLYAAGPAPLP